MKNLIIILGLAVGLFGCGERVDFPSPSFLQVTCAISAETETTVTFGCSDGTEITVNKPERVVEVEVEVIREVEVEVIVEVPVEVCTETKIVICTAGETLAVSLDALESFKGSLVGACPVPPELTTLCHKPGTPAEKTMTLPEPAASAHLDSHGDYLGACEELDD